jgi:glucose/arabinose dehydrogenase
MKLTMSRTLLLTTATASLCGAVAAQQLLPLPEPFATESARNPSSIVPTPDGAGLKVPPGFSISLFADRVPQARMMVWAPNGDLFVAQSRAGTITVMRGGSPEARSEFATGLQNPFGLAFQNGYLYVGETTKVSRYTYQPGDVKASGPPEKLVDLPRGGHSTRNIAFSADGRKMYIAVGSMSNKSAGEDPVRAAINEYNPDGTGHRVFASGIRNPVGLTLLPGTNTLWTSVNERDTLGDDLVPDYITSVKDGGFYGWPYSYIGSHPDPEHAGKMPDLVKTAIVPDLLLGAHVAALSITFYTGSQFPQRYRNGAFVGLHGSWNRSKPSGYKVAFVPFADGKPSGPLEDFVTGWLVNETPATAWGRPVGVTVGRDGTLLVADDSGGKIWRVKYGTAGG